MEIGMFDNLTGLRIGLTCECYPVWLPLLQSTRAAEICITNFRSKEHLLDHLTQTNHSISLVQYLLSIGHLSCVNFNQDPSNTYDIILLSGSLLYLSTYAKNLGSSHPPVLGVLDEHFRGRLRNGRPSGIPLAQFTWKRIRHASVGGPTDYTTLFMYSEANTTAILTNITRFIRDILDTRIRPTFSKQGPDILAPPAVYYVNSVLLPGAYARPVLMHTDFYCNGWGLRPLTLSELGVAHGYPRHMNDFLAVTDLALPPQQVLAAMFTPMARVLVKHSTRAAASTMQNMIEAGAAPLTSPTPTSTWFPTINKSLSHLWVDESLITQKAFKRDDALVPSHLWDARLILIYPRVNVHHLQTIRHWLLGCLCRRLYLEFLVYLNEMYNTPTSAWLERYMVGRHTKRIPHSGGDKSQRHKRRKLNGTPNGDQFAMVQEFDQLTDSSESMSTHKFYESSNESVSSDDCTNNSINTGDTLCTKNTNTDQLTRDIQVGQDILLRFGSCTWWEWTLGSTLIFWRWGAHMELARSGMAPFIAGKLPRWRRPSRKPTPIKLPLVLDKLKQIIERGYVAPGYVSSLTDFFDVPKGDDIRLVYNGSSCGLNQALWSPNFWLPFPRTALRLLDFNYFSVDMDLGEMFLNFPLHQDLQEFSGIDLTPYRSQLGIPPAASPWFRWTRNWMGARSSPHSSVRYYYLAEEFVRGNQKEVSNPMRWDFIVLNLPGSTQFNPSRPRVQKWDKINNRLAGDIVTFVDDIRATGQTVEHAWAVSRQAGARFQYKGIQDASRKRRPPTRCPGAWAGAVFATTETTVTNTVTAEKWSKGQRIVKALWDQLNVPGKDWRETSLDYKEMEIIRGYLGHLSMTFELLVPYLKGFHLVLAAHLDKRDKEGWRYTESVWRVLLANGEVEESDDSYSPHNHPKKVKPLQQLYDDVYALQCFFSAENPPIIQDRCSTIQVVRYGFGDASGSGFGSTIQTESGLKYRIGIWGSDDDTESSNYKELANVVSTIEDEASSGNLINSIIYFFTDNSTVESALYKGNSRSKRLFELVVRFRKMQFQYGTQVVVSHVSGKRMIAQGTDGVSRGNLMEGVGSGLDMMTFIPIHQNAIERHPPLEIWLRSWLGNELEVLTPDDWYGRGHDHHGGSYDTKGFWRTNTKPGLFLWIPPPAAAETALEEIRRATLKRQHSTHVFACPRLLSTEWRKQLFKAADVVVSLAPGLVPTAWPVDMYEPLTIGFIFPFLPFKPWQRRGTPKMFAMARKLSGKDERDVEAPGEEERLEQVWGSRRQSNQEYTHARDGDHLMVPFECDHCVFKKLRGHPAPTPIVLRTDVMLMATIRRAILDSFWSRASSTVRANKDKVRHACQLSESLGLMGPYSHTCFMPVYDHCGYEVALQMLQNSLRPGRHSSSYTQWDTIRKVRTSHSNFLRSSAQANRSTVAFSDEKGLAQRLTSDECSSYWFSRFAAGCKRRMGQDWRPNKAMSTELIVMVLDKANERVMSAESDIMENDWSTFGAFIAIAYVLSFRGSEGLLLDLKGLRGHKDTGGVEGSESYFIIALLGKVKGEHHDRCHLFPCVSKTSSGIPVEVWVRRLAERKHALGFTDGPAISDIQGKVKTTAKLDEQLIEILEEIYETTPKLFPPSITSRDDIITFYSVFRSPRRSSDTRALEMNVSVSDIESVNRWESREKSKGNRPNLPMRQHYAQVELLLKPFIRYTKAM